MSAGGRGPWPIGTLIHVWVDGVHFTIRLEEDRLAVVVGVRPDGTKVIAIEDGYRESTESWLAVLRDPRTRIQSTFATVKLRTRVTKGAGSRTAGLTMAFKLLEAAQNTWRRLDAQDLLPLVRAGIVVQGMGSTWNEGSRPHRKRLERSPPNQPRSTTLDNISTTGL